MLYIVFFSRITNKKIHKVFFPVRANVFLFSLITADFYANLLVSLSSLSLTSTFIGHFDIITIIILVFNLETFCSIYIFFLYLYFILYSKVVNFLKKKRRKKNKTNPFLIFFLKINA